MPTDASTTATTPKIENITATIRFCATNTSSCVFGLPTKSSEFLMINDENLVADCIIMDQNYWYPYGLFSLYALRIFRWIESRAATASFTVDKSRRYVYVERFFRSVCNEHADDRKTMRAHERFEVPG